MSFELARHDYMVTQRSTAWKIRALTHLLGLRSRCESYASDGYFSGMAGALSVNTTYSEIDVKRQ